MTAETSELTVAVADGEVPVAVIGAGGPGEPASPNLPGILCVPSIFGGNPDLLEQLATLTDVALPVVMDPFWRVEAGAIPYTEREAAFERVGKFDRDKAPGDVEAVARWLAGRTNGKVVGLGICFGGPQVLLGAAGGWLHGVVTWHGSRMEQFLDRVVGSEHLAAAPMRHHLGEDDPISPPEAIAAIQAAFADHGDCSIVVHPSADHGFSHEGPAWDARATAAGMIDLRDLALLLGS